MTCREMQGHLLFTLPVLCIIFAHPFTLSAQGRDIYVSSENGTLSSSCWDGGIEEPCKTLSLALEGMKQSNQTTVYIQNGMYSLNASSSENSSRSEWEFVWMHSLAIVGLPDNEPDITDSPSVQIECEDGAGLSFFYSENITVKGVELIGCGALHKSTSQNFSNTDSFTFAEFHSALYFMFCVDVILEHVYVLDSRGIGAVIYSTVGNNFIQSSKFLSNAAHEGYPGGGGLYIEFSYCTPDMNNNQDKECTASNVPPEYVSDATFTIDSCTFQNNTATLLHPDEHTFILPQLSHHLAFGRGGGISVFFKGNAANNTVLVDNSQLIDNQALWGAGLFVEFQDMSNNNEFIMQSSNIGGNECENSSSERSGTGGGGARVGYIFYDPTHCHHNSITFSDVNFFENRAYYGGGLSFYTAREPSEQATNGLTFNRCFWGSNIARVGSAADISVWHPIPRGAIVRPVFADCSFLNNTAQYTSATRGSFVGIGALYVDSVPVEFDGSVIFVKNSQSALASVSTGIYFQRDSSALFADNRGRNGGAIALMGYSFIQVANGSNLTFVNNEAEIKGGAIYGHSIGEHDLISSRNCFIRYEDILATPDEWNSSFFFASNVAGSKNNSIYVTSLLTCLWGGAFGSTTSDTSRVFCWNGEDDNDKRWEYESGNCTDEIATSPATFHSNNSDSEKFSMYAIPGKKELLPIDTLDDRNKNVTGETVLFATALTSNIYIDSSSMYISDNQIELHGKPNVKGTLKLETTGPRVVSTKVDVLLQPCPLGFVLDTTEHVCRCGEGYGGLVTCHGVNFSSQIQRGSWMGHIDEDIYAGQCPYCALITDDRYMNLSSQPLQDEFCGMINRKGVLCGECLDGYGPVVNSEYYECEHCPPSKVKRNWFFYLLTEFLPIAIFFLIVVLFNVSATSGPANAYVFFAQVLPTVFNLDGDGSIQLDNIASKPRVLKAIYVIPYDIWNLNFFHPLLPKFCLSSNISTLDLLSTGYVTAFFPLLLVSVFYVIVLLYGKGLRPIVCLFRPVHFCFARFRSIWNLQRSVLHALATFILISYTKFTLVSFILLTSTPLLTDKGQTHGRVVYFDGTIEYFSKRHIPYIVVSFLVLLTFVALPPIILTVPSILHYIQKFSRKLRRDVDLDCCQRCQGPNWEQFLNAFHGCYQDGTGGGHQNGETENNHDYRWFAGLYFLLRLILFAVYAFTPDWFVQYTLQQLVCMCAFAAFMVFRPYKNDFYNRVDAGMFVLLAAISTLTMYNYYLTVIESDLSPWAFWLQYVLILCPLVYIIIYVVYNFFKNHHQKLKTCCVKIFPFSKLYRVADDEDEENDRFLEDAERSGRLMGRELVDSDSVTIAVNRQRHAAEANLALLHEQERSSANNSGGTSGSSGYGATASSGTQTSMLNLNDDDSAGTGVEMLDVDPVKLHSDKRSKLFRTH